MFTGAPEARVLNTDPDYTSRPFIAVLRPDSLALNVTQMTLQAVEAKNYFTFGNSLPYTLQALICLCEL